MPRKKILWLCSWYPNRLEPFNGDFIQRHAVAASGCHDIYVIHVAGDSTGSISRVENEILGSAPLTEERIYYPVSRSVAGKVQAHYRFLQLYRQAIRRYIQRFGKPDLVHVHIPMKAGMPGIWVKRTYRVPYIVTEHWGIYNDVAEDKFINRGRFFRYYTRKIFREAAAFISVSRYLGEGVNRLVLPVNFRVIPNTVNTDLFFCRPQKSPVFRFIHVSNMVPLKNAGGILRAFSQLPPGTVAELVMVGDTDPSIRAYAEQLGLPAGSVRFRGEISYRDVAAEMQQAHCLILFSNIENSPCVIGEALCCGLPVIATRVGGIPELVDETNALLVGAGQEKELTGAMLAMLSAKDRYQPAAIAEKAAARFSYQAVGKLLDAVYEEQAEKNTGILSL